MVLSLDLGSHRRRCLATSFLLFPTPERIAVASGRGRRSPARIVRITDAFNLAWQAGPSCRWMRATHRPGIILSVGLLDSGNRLDSAIVGFPPPRLHTPATTSRPSHRHPRLLLCLPDGKPCWLHLFALPSCDPSRKLPRLRRRQWRARVDMDGNQGLGRGACRRTTPSPRPGLSRFSADKLAQGRLRLCSGGVWLLPSSTYLLRPWLLLRSLLRRPLRRPCLLPRSSLLRLHLLSSSVRRPSRL